MSRRVAIIVETALASGREILSGIARYTHERNDWTVFFQAGPLGLYQPHALRQWQVDGILARVADESVLALVEPRKVPTVDLLGNLPRARLPLVCCDDAAIAGMVAEHFGRRGHRHFAFFGLRGETWSEHRREAFAAASEAAGGTTFAHREISHADRNPDQWERFFTGLCSWIADLPKPVGLMVASDQFGPDILQACHRLELAVPEQVSVVGVDNDVAFCEVCQPRLSSVEPNHERLGYEAARLLDRLMAGEPAPAAPLVIPPRFLQTRQSSDAAAVEDPVIVRALGLVRAHATRGISVDEIARRSGVSRSVLQRRFRQHLGRTVNETLVAARLNRAKEMLAKTDLPLAEIAERAGFNHQEYLGQVFRRATGQTPAAFRREAGRTPPLNPRGA